MLPYTDYGVLAPECFPLAKAFLCTIHKVLGGQPVKLHMELNQKPHHSFYDPDPKPIISIQAENPYESFDPKTEIKYQASFIMFDEERLEKMLAKSIFQDKPWLCIKFEGQLRGIPSDAYIQVVHKLKTGFKP